MAKRIELTWKTDKGRTVIEQCTLPDEDDPIFLVGDETPLTITTDQGTGNTVGVLMGERVIFQDDDGIFGLLPEQVLNIKEL